MERRGVVRPPEREAVDRAVTPRADEDADPSWAWATRTWSAVTGDLALHGISYLGVLFVLAGLLGLVLLALATDTPGLRPLVGLAVPIALFGSAAFLRRVRAVAGATVVELLGGLATAAEAFLSMVDGSPLPPDPATPQGRHLAWAAIALGLAATYAVAAVMGQRGWRPRRDARRGGGGDAGGSAAAGGAPGATVSGIGGGVGGRGAAPGGADGGPFRYGHALRWLVGPLAWVGVGAAGLGLTGGPSAIQMAVVAVAILLTTIVAVRNPAHPLGTPTAAAAAPCMAVAFLLTIALGGGGPLGAAWDGPPPGEPLAAGLAALVTAELLGRNLRRQRAATLAQALTLVVLGIALLPGPAAAWYGALAVPTFLGLIEWQLLHHRGHPVRPAVLVSLAGAAGGLVLAAASPWSAVVGWGTASAWLHARRLRHPDGQAAANGANGAADGGSANGGAAQGGRGATAAPLPAGPGPAAPRQGRPPPAADSGLAPSTLAPCAALVPLGAVAGLVVALPAARALVTVGAVLAVLAVAVNARIPGDLFYATWLPLAAAGVGAGTMLAPGAPGELAAAAGLSAVALALSPRHPVLRLTRPRPGRPARPRRWPLPLLEVGATVTGVWAVMLGARVVRLPLPAVAGVLAAAAVAAGLLARARQQPALRPVAALLALGAAGSALAATEPPAATAGTLALTAGTLLGAATIALWLRRPSAPWLQALVVAGSAAAVAGLALAAALALATELGPAPGGEPADWPPLLAAALAVAALQAAVAGCVARQAVAMAAAPLLALGAWVTLATSLAVTGWQWYLLPGGLALLAAAEALRWGRRRAGAPLDRWWLRGPEIAGMLMAGGPPIALAVIEGPAYGLLGALLGGALLTWGLVTKVRRRAAAGVAGTLAGIALMLLVPLGRALPRGDGDSPALWLLLAAAGLGLLLAASSLEHRRGHLAEAFRRLDRALDGWE